MYINIEEAKGLCFSDCQTCTTSCCDGGRFIVAPLVMEDFKSVYEKFLIAFALIDDKLRVVMLISNRNKPCIYYKDKRCTIYEERPPACVLYPYTPYFDEVLIDTACEAVGDVGLSLTQDADKLLEKVHPSFYHKRLEGFSSKLEVTQEFLDNLDNNFEAIVDIEGITLMSYVGKEDNEFLKMHKASLVFASEWN